ncbi:hypothetical protein GCK72_007229 [Caenorhabditis remanei]|uniref:F-box associated domain-containing protein n=1 Tax=Caenorhabditis remanei TaxID=31234 RepID=A0A6A5HGU8_CAERE|nr:hypothetical protein GCK72_007229 [Caenorhabditis remanei]KAF1767270.1 hypothetical protein GCK72_007229 [Caenorhabditis remanei]
MTPPLSYPALKSVLEYVVVEKRIHLTSRSKFLQRIDKTIPVYAKSIRAWGDNVKLNSLLFTGKNNYHRAEDEMNGMLLISYLRGRSSINVNLAVFSTVNTSQDIPVKLDLTINKLQTICCNLEVVLSMINSRSLPLTEFSTIIDKPTNVDLEIVRSAKNVIFSTSDKVIGLEKLSNKSVRFRVDGLHTNTVAKIIKYWVQNGKEVGTEFTISYSTNLDLSLVVANLQEQFHKTRGYSEAINEHSRSGFCIQLSSTSKLIVHGMEKLEVNGHDVYNLVLKIVLSH